MADISYEDAASRIGTSIRVGIYAHEDWSGPSIKPGTLTEEQIDWLSH